MTDQPERQDLHNCSIDDELATRFDRCGQIHLQSGRRCVREMHHQESCHFVDAKEAVRIASSNEMR